MRSLALQTSPKNDSSQLAEEGAEKTIGRVPEAGTRPTGVALRIQAVPVIPVNRLDQVLHGLSS